MGIDILMDMCEQGCFICYYCTKYFLSSKDKQAWPLYQLRQFLGRLRKKRRWYWGWWEYWESSRKAWTAMMQHSRVNTLSKPQENWGRNHLTREMGNSSPLIEVGLWGVDSWQGLPLLNWHLGRVWKIHVQGKTKLIPFLLKKIEES